MLSSNWVKPIYQQCKTAFGDFIAGPGECAVSSDTMRRSNFYLSEKDVAKKGLIFGARERENPDLIFKARRVM